MRPDRRSQGIGTLLLHTVDRRAAELGKGAVILEVVDTNPRAKALYEQLGYRTVHTTQRVLFRLAGFRRADLMMHGLHSSSAHGSTP